MNEVHSQFNKIRSWLRDNNDFEPKSYVLLAEKVSKIIYNCSAQSAPFNSNSGFSIPSLAFQTAGYFEDNRLEEEVKSTILLSIRGYSNYYNNWKIYCRIDGYADVSLW